MSRPLTLARILEAAERVRRSPRYYNIVKNNRRLAVLEVEGEREFVSAGFLTAELDTPGYAERHRKHSPRLEGPLLTRESDLLAAGLQEIGPDHPDFPEWLDTFFPRPRPASGLTPNGAGPAPIRDGIGTSSSSFRTDLCVGSGPPPRPASALYSIARRVSTTPRTSTQVAGSTAEDRLGFRQSSPAKASSTSPMLP